jgi:ubiquinone/menaquinone biosynthesis C-methylase UbiE
VSDSVRHPIFVRVYEWLSGAEEESGEADHRRELLHGLSGRVIEVGAGNGLNFRHYPATVSEVVAVEPENYLRERAAERTAQAHVPVTLLDGLAEELPAEDGRFDAAVASLVLCSVPDQATALAEIRRVLRPGGELRFYEHVVAAGSGFARMQRMLGKVWPIVGGGCHPDRDTAAAIAAAGFEIDACRRFDFIPSPLVYPLKPKILGRAHREP